MNVVKPGDERRYLDEAASFDGQRVLSAQRSKALAWIIAAAATGVCGVMALAIAMMMPLKSKEVYVFRVDSTSGNVELVAPPSGPQTYNEASNKYWAGKYVMAREGYYAEQGPHDYRTVLLMSDEAEQRRHQNAVGKNNKDAPQNALGADGQIRVKIVSIAFPQAKIVQVRFQKSLEQRNSKKETNWIATFAYNYVEGPSSENDRLVNPLGFQVSEYRIDPEAL